MRLEQIFEQIALFERHADIIDRLMQWKDDPAILLSFTDLPKIGINPTSGFDTPLAIYTYPLREMWTDLVQDTVPFAGDRTYVQVLRAAAPVLELSQYGHADLERDLERLRPEWNEKLEGSSRRHLPPARLRREWNLHAQQQFGVDMESLTPEQVALVTSEVAAKRDVMSDFDLLVERQKQDARVQTAAGLMWNITRGLAEAAADKTFRKPSVIWNVILRSLGYRIISDRTGLAIIHMNEPVQVAVLAGDAIRHVAMLHNVRKTIRRQAGFNKLEVNYMLDLAEEMVMRRVDGDYAPKGDVMIATKAINHEWHELLMTGESHHFKLSERFSDTGLSQFVSQCLRKDYRDLPKIVEILTSSPFLKSGAARPELALGLVPPSETRNKRWAWTLFCKTMMTPERLAADSATYTESCGRPADEYVFNRVRGIFRFLSRISERAASQATFEAAWKQFTSFIGADVMAAITGLTGLAPLVDAIKVDYERVSAAKTAE